MHSHSLCLCHIKCTMLCSLGTTCQKGLIPISGSFDGWCQKSIRQVCPLRVLGTKQHRHTYTHTHVRTHTNTEARLCWHAVYPGCPVAPGPNYTCPAALWWRLICLIRTDGVFTSPCSQFTVTPSWCLRAVM